MIGGDTFRTVFGGAPAHTESHLTEHLRAMIRHGYSPVLLKPGSKEPACILSSAAEAKANREAQAAAELAGARRTDSIRHACGFRHVLDDPAKVGPVVKRFLERWGGANTGIHLGRSRRLVVDVDTVAERQGFVESWVNFTPGQTDQRAPGITVESPGRYDNSAQKWVHQGGGHWYFTVPDDFVFPIGKVLKGPGGWAAMWGESYVLTPPSTRAEGPYRLVGGEHAAPAWLLGQITAQGAARAMAADQRQDTAMRGGPIDRWSAAMPWAVLLERHGWLEAGSVAQCGCPDWTGPGEHANPKSATAHDLACARFDTDEGWGPLHIWTDHPPEPLPAEGTVTKLQFVSAMEYGGDTAAAIKALGLGSDAAAHLIGPASFSPIRAEATGNGWDEVVPGGFVAGQSMESSSPADPFGTPSSSRLGPTPPADVQDVTPTEPLASWAPIDLGPYLDGTHVAPTATLLQRSDGLGLLYPRMTHSLHGESESGKSWVALWELSRLIKAEMPCAMVDFESDAGVVVSRLLLLGTPGELISKWFAYRRPERSPAGDPEELAAWNALMAAVYVLVVLDGVTDAMGLFGKASKDNDDAAAFAKLLPRQIADRTGAAVLMIDHVTKDKDSRGRFALGGQAKMASLTGAAFTVDVIEPLGEGLRGELELRVAKDRHGRIRGQAGPMRSDRTQAVARFVFDSTQPWAPVVALVPQVDESGREQAVADARSAKIVDHLRRYPGQGQREISAEMGIRQADLQPLLGGLEAAGVIEIVKIGQKHTHTVIDLSYGTDPRTDSTDTRVPYRANRTESDGIVP
jgi:hypothetical protein